jgi:DNA polymerase-3 subunit epsilon
LADKPRFADVVDRFLAFIQDATQIIHNATFDVGFLNHELALCHREPLQHWCPPPIDTLLMARDLHPGKRNSLDALCERYGVDNSKRTYHGALLDSELLADVYLAMTRGQESLVMELAPIVPTGERASTLDDERSVIAYPSDEELELHVRVLESIQKASKGECRWLQQVATEPKAQET